jgi:hypothetical protein
LKNCAAGGNNWLGLTLEGVTCNRDAVGAKVFWTAGGTKRSRLKTGEAAISPLTTPAWFSASELPHA